MKGKWHFIALAACVGILTNVLNQYLFFVLFSLWLVYLFKRLEYKSFQIVLTFASLLFFTLYIPSNNFHNKDYLYFEDPKTLVGYISSAVSISPAKIEFQFFESNMEQTFQIVHFFDNTSSISSNDFRSVKHGSSCEIKGEINHPQPSRNPGQFDYQNYLAKQGIYYQMIVQSPSEIKCEGSSHLEYIYSLRFKMIEYTTNRLSPDTTSWLNALIFGDSTQLEEDVIELFRGWGLSHLLAISGLHVGLITAVIYFLLIKLTVLTKEKAQWLMIVFLPVYALIAGGEPSVWRACLMVLVFILLNKMNVKLNATDVLSVVFIVLIITNPYIVYHIGFQYSFLVTLALILSKRWFMITQSSIFRVFQISFISQMIILPLQLAYFYTFQPLSILLNVVVVPYFSLFVIPYLLLLFFLSPLPIAPLFDSLFTFIHRGFISITYVIDQYLDYPLVIGEISLGLALLYYAIFILWMRHLEYGHLWSSIKYGLMVTLLILYLVCVPYLSPYGSVTMLDIGQGDAFVIELPYRKGVIFIDAGAHFSFTDFTPSNKVYRRIIKPYLHSRGINKIDAIFLSHEDSDHVGSVPFIVEDMKVDLIVMSDLYQLDDEHKRLFVENDINVVRTSHGDHIIINGAEFKVLGPVKDQMDTNDNSLVLLTAIGGKSWLFTGDIGVNMEKQLLQSYPKLKVDVLKVAHHGSHTSTSKAFIQAVRPQYGLISVGQNNMYGHPSEEVIKVLEQENVKVLRTDQNGAVQYRYTNNNGTFLIYRP